MSTTWIRVVYGVALALLVAGSAVLGIQLISPGPKPPAIPDISVAQLADQGGDTSDSSSNASQQLVQATSRFFDDSITYRSAIPAYRRNVVLAVIGIAVVVVLIGLALPALLNHLRWGLVFGSFLLLAYAGYVATRAVPDVPIAGSFPVSLLAAGEPGPLSVTSRMLLFTECFVGLLLALFLGVWRLTAWTPVTRAPIARSAPAQPSLPGAPVLAAPAEPAASQWHPAPAAGPQPAPRLPAAPPASDAAVPVPERSAD